MSQDPLIEIAVEPKSRADAAKLAAALSRIASEDSDFQFSVDHESGQTVIKGMSEPHLETVIGRLKSEFEVDVKLGAPQVAYRETITRQVNVDYTHKKQTGGSGQFARVKLLLEPLPAGTGFQFESKITDGTVPKEHIPGIEKGVKGALESGVLAGFPVIDLKVQLMDGTYHEVDSNALAFEIAAHAAMKEGLAKAGSKLLEPVMNVEVVTPRDYMGDVIGDLNLRRGRITGQDRRGNAEVLIAHAPLANMFGYANSLRSMSRDRAEFTMQFSHYERVPRYPPPDDDEPFPPAVGLRA
jgi:elongation factor G